MSIKLTERLQCIADMTGSVAAAADIGCDHGRLSVYLAQQGVKVIAVDISPQSLRKAELLAARRRVEGMVDCRLGDGLMPLKPGEVQAIIISGIGQRNIAEILDKGGRVANGSEFIVLQPMDGAMLLRRELCSLGYRIEDETLAREGRRLHPVIKAVQAGKEMKLGIAEQALGPVLLGSKSKYMHDYLLEQLRIWSSIAEGRRRATEIQESGLMDINQIIDAIGERLSGSKGN